MFGVIGLGFDRRCNGEVGAGIGMMVRFSSEVAAAASS